MEEPPVANNKHAEEAAAGNKTTPPQCPVSIYRAKFAGAARTVTVVWIKNLIHHSLSVSVSVSVDNNKSTTRDVDRSLTCYKVDLKPWPFWSKKGSKSLDVDGAHVCVSWNFRLAKFSDGPEPVGGYYVALACDGEVVLLLGDRKKKAYRKTRSMPSLEEAALVWKKENVFGKKWFSAMARFVDGGGGSWNKKEQDIEVVNSISEHKEPEIWISIDGMILIHVKNLQWKFRGNETVWVKQVPVQVFWDVMESLHQAIVH